jgi:2-polyprenyl-3-methyl-5-hydroxy-6-metoxy-1,4-benzoquinol methylase
MPSPKQKNSIVTRGTRSVCGMRKDIVNGGNISPYYEWFRRDVIAAVSPAAKTVLSVGCAGGITEAAVVKQGMKVVGIELNPEAAKIARQRGLTVLEGDVSEIDVGIAGEFYDCIIYADILEHLPGPAAVLKRHVEYLKPSGTVYVSIPNFRHYSVFWELFVRGNVRYKDAGILDRTHLRITTRKMVLEWFEQAGLKLVRWKYINNRKKAKLISACFLWLAQEFTAVQIGVIGKKE